MLELETDALSARVRASELEARLEQAEAQAQELSQTLSDRQSAIEILEADLKQARKSLEEQPTLIVDAPQSTHNTRQVKGNSTAEHDLAIAQAKVEELETELARQLTAQAMLQHAWQELEEDRDRQQSRVADLENQTNDMQEQILRQAQQASEYETAVQHWKDRYVATQSGVLRLKELIEKMLPNPPAEVIELLTTIQASTSGIPEPASPAQLSSSSLAQPTKVDLPEFLMRRRSYKARRS
jgi:chromosome segregation ATPase